MYIWNYFIPTTKDIFHRRSFFIGNGRHSRSMIDAAPAGAILSLYRSINPSIPMSFLIPLLRHDQDSSHPHLTLHPVISRDATPFPIPLHLPNHSLSTTQMMPWSFEQRSLLGYHHSTHHRATGVIAREPWRTRRRYTCAFLGPGRPKADGKNLGPGPARPDHRAENIGPGPTHRSESPSSLGARAGTLQ
jgi:hypothetical protein